MSQGQFDGWLMGEFKLNKPLTEEHREFLANYADEDHEGEDTPSRFCQWIPNDDGTAILWDEGEKFRHFDKWIEYLIDTYLKPWGYNLNGEVVWEGNQVGELGTVRVRGNEVEIYNGYPCYGNPESDPVLSALESFVGYLSEEGDDFLENLGDFELTEEALAMDFDDVHDEIVDAICKFDVKETIDTINKYVKDSKHIYMDVLNATLLMQQMRVKA